jgi:CheY-like chemotaxis protein
MNEISGMRILCIEDQPEDMATLTHMLQGIGYEVMPATSGREAIDLLTKQAIDGVLLEYNIPEGIGGELRAELKRIRPEVPVLVFAGVGSQTPFMLRFFDAYLRNSERFEDGPGDFES